ncbi:MAG: hypothetical protein AAF492_30700 [Verrucomicrobiota bacterium]
MQKWLSELVEEMGRIKSRLLQSYRSFHEEAKTIDRTTLKWGMRLGIAILVMILIVVASTQHRTRVPKPVAADLGPARFIDYTIPVREEPKRFRANTTMPKTGEGKASVSIGVYDFDPETDLIHVDDRRVWWESEHDKNDTEDDHQMHFAMEAPFRRLVELVEKAGGKLKVQDIYRDSGIHAPRSLHKEGRAIDITSEKISLEKLAKLSWAAGFDWVFYESPKKGGAHIHASVKPIPDL